MIDIIFTVLAYFPVVLLCTSLIMINVLLNRIYIELQRKPDNPYVTARVKKGILWKIQKRFFKS